MSRAKLTYEFLNEGGDVVRMSESPVALRVTEKGFGSTEWHLDTFPDEMVEMFTWTGIKKVAGDSMGAEDAGYEDANARRDRIMAGEWYGSRGTGGGASVLAEAVSRFKPDKYATAAVAAAHIATLSKVDQAALGRFKEIGELMDVIRAERRQAAPAAQGDVNSLI